MLGGNVPDRHVCSVAISTEAFRNAHAGLDRRKTYLVRRDQGLGVWRNPRKLDRRHGAFGQEPDGGHREVQVPVAEGQVDVVGGQPAPDPVHGLSLEDRQHGPADRAHPVRIHGGDARQTAAVAVGTDAAHS